MFTLTTFGTTSQQHTQNIINSFKYYNILYSKTLLTTVILCIIINIVTIFTAILLFQKKQIQDNTTQMAIQNMFCVFFIIFITIIIFYFYCIINSVQSKKYDNYSQLLQQDANLYQKFLDENSDINLSKIQINQIKQHSTTHPNIYHYNNKMYIDISNSSKLSDLWDPINKSYELYLEPLSSAQRAQETMTIFLKEKVKFFKSI